MLATASKSLKRHAPHLHRWMKQAFLRSKLPSPKLLNGKWTFVAPQLLGVEPTEPHVLQWIEEELRSGDTFFDVGAHYGWMSLAACHRAGPNGKVVAFEPSPSLVEVLQYNKHVNGFHQLEIVAKAISNVTHRIAPFYLFDHGDSFLNSLVAHSMEAPNNSARQASMIEVETTTIDAYSGKTGLKPALIKIDVEGAELFVLEGCNTILKECRPKFIVAVHPTWLPDGQSADQLFHLFREHSYKIKTSKTVKYDSADFGDYLFTPDSFDR